MLDQITSKWYFGNVIRQLGWSKREAPLPFRNFCVQKRFIQIYLLNINCIIQSRSSSRREKNMFGTARKNIQKDAVTGRSRRNKRVEEKERSCTTYCVIKRDPEQQYYTGRSGRRKNRKKKKKIRTTRIYFVFCHLYCVVCMQGTCLVRARV